MLSKAEQRFFRTLGMDTQAANDVASSSESGAMKVYDMAIEHCFLNKKNYGPLVEVLRVCKEKFLDAKLQRGEMLDTMLMNAIELELKENINSSLHKESTIDNIRDVWQDGSYVASVGVDSHLGPFVGFNDMGGFWTWEIQSGQLRGLGKFFLEAAENMEKREKTPGWPWPIKSDENGDRTKE